MSKFSNIFKVSKVVQLPLGAAGPKTSKSLYLTLKGFFTSALKLAKSSIVINPLFFFMSSSIAKAISPLYIPSAPSLEIFSNKTPRSFCFNLYAISSNELGSGIYLGGNPLGKNISLDPGNLCNSSMLVPIIKANNQ